MAYTVKQLSKISGITVRTLHYYDEIGLLKPAYIGQQGYRFYGESELLELQQILFYREMDVPLNEIQKLMHASRSNKIAVLQKHRLFMEEKIHRYKQLVKTLDKTILHIKGEQKMNAEEFYYGFDSKKQQNYEKYLVENYGDKAKSKIAESKRRTKDWKKEDWTTFKNSSEALWKKFTTMLTSNVKAEDPKVQILVQEWFEMLSKFYDPDKETFLGLGELYCENEDFRKFYKRFHPQLPEYVKKAMEFFAERKFGK